MRAIWKQLWQDRILDEAAMVSFYSVLAVFPFLLFWFYLSGIAILVGGELNSMIETRLPRVSKPPARK